ncbi:Protein S-acyltransferase 24 [Taenia solium]
MYLALERNKIPKTPYLRDEILVNPIFKEARSGLKKLKKYLEGCPELLTITDAFKDTLLHHAAFGDAFKTAAYLDSFDSNLNSPNAIGQCPFMTSCLSGSFETAALLLCRSEDVNRADKTRLSAIHLVECQDTRKNTPLHVACAGGNMATASGILRATLYPPPTHFKVTDAGTLCAVSVKRDYNVTIRNEEGQTPEHVAGRHGYYELAALIQKVYKDPGFLPTNTFEYEEEMREASRHNHYLSLFYECRRLQKRTSLLSVEGEAPQTELLPLQIQALRRSIRIVKRRLRSLCHTCGCIKPIRAKHCSLCNRCVRVMDHHCPVTDNCVGQDNRVWFLLTSAVVSIVSSWIASLAVRYWQQTESTSLYEIVTLILLSIGWMFGLNACFMTLSCALFNMTTNELTNWRRYEHFGSAKTGFRNPFNQGYWGNVVEFFRPRYYETERELYKYRGTDGGRHPFVV